MNVINNFPSVSVHVSSFFYDHEILYSYNNKKRILTQLTYTCTLLILSNEHLI